MGWDRFIGRWETEGSHPLLPGEAIRGTSSFEWLDGERFLIWRAKYEHPEIPERDLRSSASRADQLSMHYFDHRGEYRTYSNEPRPRHVAVLARCGAARPVAAVHGDVQRGRRDDHRPWPDVARRRHVGGRPRLELPQGRMSNDIGLGMDILRARMSSRLSTVRRIRGVSRSPSRRRRRSRAPCAPARTLPRRSGAARTGRGRPLPAARRPSACSGRR